MATVLLAVLAPGQAQCASQRLYTFEHPAMATVFRLSLYSADAARAAEVSSEVFDEVDRVEQLLSNYRESSELSRLNQEAVKAPVTTDPEMMDFLVQSAHWSEVSDGAFDITVGKLMKAWGFYRHQGHVPPAAELDQLRTETGWRKVQLDAARRMVRFTAPGVELDPGGIGKGFAVDAAVRVLRADQVRAALLSAGSSTLFALGAPPHRRGWRIVVPGPLPRNGTLSMVTLRDESLSSADCSQKNFVLDGHLYCHIMNPRTLRPVEGRIQVSVIHPSATASDALSNVAFVLAPEQTVRTLAGYAPQASALIVSVDGSRPSCAVFRWRAPVDHAHCEQAMPLMH
ncbi:FAD:protein FMN transferase [Acidipila sp. EB88]|uniref:FAD:protein FMN transferase n=1 Tax=Acidipila sp. EB88 TaxID=2305226 RepID=UPI001F24A53C|nr:FAD:protein FMN transferase [Acidipila sp. EB88]